MNRTAKRLTALVVPVAALVLAAGGTAVADEPEFLNTKIATTDSGYQSGSASEHHGASTTGAETHSLLLETGADNSDDDSDD
ncbi:hypothetical protein [Streptomyces ochraceiscleroticus]|uniref:Secreted protein n=1 Tax=Streptomyces ochraceiscleroticus TaxID=47761 RepID=A0ABW1MJT1_9ACTN|nr:hypothetical protein [Streptomyces ochraceiscleroticus]